MSRVLPILFNTEMVRAILDGRKTVTRRLVKFEGNRNPNWTGYIKDGLTLYNGTNEPCNKPCPYKVGDILYVRETWTKDNHRYMYRADYSDSEKFYQGGKEVQLKWHPSLHMPKEATRIFLKVKDVRLERLQGITEEQAKKEGCQTGSFEYKGSVWGQEDYDEWTAIDDFVNLWNSTIKKADLARYGWDANPWVWVIEFDRCEKPEEDKEDGRKDVS